MRPISVGFIGAGNVLFAYLQALDRLIPTGVAVLGGIYARSRSRRRELLQRRPAMPLYDTADALLASHPDLVVVITPPESHAALARAALTSGSHVLLEKPFATSLSEGRMLVNAARRARRFLVAAPFVHLSPTFRFLQAQVLSGAIGAVHTARGLYGNVGAHWASWYYLGSGGPLADLGIYNLKTLTAILGPVRSIFHHEAHSGRRRTVKGRRLAGMIPDVAHTLVTHSQGATSVLVSSHAIVNYERPALEFYGTTGTINLRGDDWDPRGVDVWRESSRCWESYPAIEPTWHWTDGLADLVAALRAGRTPTADLAHDLHLIEILGAARESLYAKRPVRVRSSWSGVSPPSVPRSDVRHARVVLHDHTRSRDSQ